MISRVTMHKSGLADYLLTGKKKIVHMGEKKKTT